MNHAPLCVIKSSCVSIAQSVKSNKSPPWWISASDASHPLHGLLDMGEGLGTGAQVHLPIHTASEICTFFSFFCNLFIFRCKWTLHPILRALCTRLLGCSSKRGLSVFCVSRMLLFIKSVSYKLLRPELWPNSSSFFVPFSVNLEHLVPQESMMGLMKTECSLIKRRLMLVKGTIWHWTC